MKINELWMGRENIRKVIRNWFDIWREIIDALFSCVQSSMIDHYTHAWDQATRDANQVQRDNDTPTVRRFFFLNIVTILRKGSSKKLRGGETVFFIVSSLTLPLFLCGVDCFPGPPLYNSDQRGSLTKYKMSKVQCGGVLWLQRKSEAREVSGGASNFLFENFFVSVVLRKSSTRLNFCQYYILKYICLVLCT